MKIAFTIIIFNGDQVLKQNLEQIYPYANQILISEGCVSYFAEKGFTTSIDKTNKIIHNFPDPENKIIISHGTYSEKTEQSNALMDQLDSETDYVWQVDSDEVYSKENIEKIISVLENKKPNTVGVCSCSFYGGFNKIIGGFELQTDNFIRIFKATPGCKYAEHRPPRLYHPSLYGHQPKGGHITSEQLLKICGAFFHHYSYVFPDQVYNKIQYYKAKVSGERCIDNYFRSVYLPWVMGSDLQKFAIEELFNGVHEFKPHTRMHSRTEQFTGQHPEAIQRDMPQLIERMTQELEKYYV